MDKIKITRELSRGSVQFGFKTHMIVRSCGKYAYVIYDSDAHQMKAPNYYGDRRSWWFSGGSSDSAVEYVADWVSYTTARKRFLEGTELI